MTAIAFPVLSRVAPGSINWSIQSNTQIFTSPLTGSINTAELPGGRWSVDFNLDGLHESDAALLQAFFMKVRGRAKRFTLHNFARPYPRGIATGTPKVKGAAQTGATLLTDGWTNSITGILKAGDFFSVNGELKMIVADATSDSSGNSTLVFEPPLRSSPSDNADIVLSKPTATFMLSGDVSQWSTQSPVLTSFSLQAMEAWS